MAMEQRVASATVERYIFIEELCAPWGFLSSITVEMERVADLSDQYIANIVDLSTRCSMSRVPIRLPSSQMKSEVGTRSAYISYLQWHGMMTVANRALLHRHATTRSMPFVTLVTQANNLLELLAALPNRVSHNSWASF